MKITMDIDLTAEEARRVLGLPDLEPFQQRVLDQMEARLTSYLDNMEPENILKNWMPMGIQGFEKWQDILWSAANSMRGGRKPTGND